VRETRGRDEGLHSRKVLLHLLIALVVGPTLHMYTTQTRNSYQNII
jgi:hypothetical protein